MNVCAPRIDAKAIPESLTFGGAALTLAEQQTAKGLMTRRPEAKEPEPEGGRAAERLRDFLERRSITVDDEEPPTAEDEPGAEPQTADDDSGG